MSSSRKRGGIRLWLASFVLVLAVALPVWFAVSALGVKFGLWNYQLGFGTLTREWGANYVFFIFIAGVVLLLLGLMKAPRVRVVILSLLIILIGGLGLGRLIGAQALIQSLPPIHDVQTDWDDPIMPSEALLKARGEGSNPIQEDPVIPPFLAQMEQGFEAERAAAQESAFSRFMWNMQVAIGLKSDRFFWEGLAGASVADEQAAAYPAVDTLYVEQDPAASFDAVANTLSDMGMEFVTRDEAAGRIEATATTQWFGFKDDVMVRVEPAGEGSQIDIRSVSRVGLSDLGANAARVEAILSQLQQVLAVMEEPPAMVEEQPPVAEPEPVVDEMANDDMAETNEDDAVDDDASVEDSSNTMQETEAEPEEE